MRILHRFFFVFLISFFVFSLSTVAHAATLSLSPSSGTFSVGSTFDASIFLNTNGKSVNALSVSLSFPPDMLQVVSPSLGQSVIGVWTAAPRFDNATGRLEFQGGIPGGITASSALISTVTFRVKSVGTALVKFLDGSKALLNDGLGTNALSQSENAIFQLKLPPPAGPDLASETNPDQSQWYKNNTVTFRFVSSVNGVQGYSYTLSDDPGTIPDDVNQGLATTVTYTDLSSGIHFFHVKSLRSGIWGGTSHYSVKIDDVPPADFKINISPSSRTTNKQPVIQFSTSDSFSGVDHYEMKIIPLSVPNSNSLFVEVLSPYVSSPLDPGDYDVIVRAYDKANNYREVTQRLVITTGFFSIIEGDGIQIGNTLIPWLWTWVILGFLILLASYIGYRVRMWHRSIYLFHKGKKLPIDVSQKLDELKRYRAKYGKKMVIALFGILSLFAGHRSFADAVPIAPPVVNTFSKDITNKEIFYIGGKTDTGNETVLIYLQNLDSGATMTQTTESDKDGNWFYRHSGFLSAAHYRIWVQGKVFGYLSPPGPQSEMVVSRTAVQFGPNRLSYDSIYVLVIMFMVLAIVILTGYITFHFYHGRKKHKEFKLRIKDAEDAIHHGFTELRKDIEEELLLVKRARIRDPRAKYHKERESDLLEDLRAIQKHIGEEVDEIEKAGEE